MQEEARVLADALTELALLSADPFDVSELLHLATDRAREVLTSDGALVLLSVDGEGLEPAGASGNIGDIDAILRTEGVPCRQSLRTGEVVIFDAERAADEFPDYAVLAAASGVKRVLSVPLKHGDTVFGTLSVARGVAVDFEDADAAALRQQADVVTSSLVRERTLREALAVTAQLEHALEARVVIEQAKGMVAAELRITVDEALDCIRRFARGRHLRLADVAGDIVDRALPAADLSS
jgi:AmiR/NasT family two-component response regulator